MKVEKNTKKQKIYSSTELIKQGKTPEEVYNEMYNPDDDTFGPFYSVEEEEEFFRYVYDLI